LYVAETDPPPAGTVIEPLFAVERPLVETQAYCLPFVVELTGSDHVKLCVEPTSHVKVAGKLLYA